MMYIEYNTNNADTTCRRKTAATVLLSSTGGRRSEQKENSKKMYVVAFDLHHDFGSHTDPRGCGTTDAVGGKGNAGAVS